MVVTNAARNLTLLPAETLWLLANRKADCMSFGKGDVRCRYTLFIPLYPVGMLAEMVLMAKSLPYLKSQKLNTITLPNAVNFSFDYHLFIQVS